MFPHIIRYIKSFLSCKVLICALFIFNYGELNAIERKEFEKLKQKGVQEFIESGESLYQRRIGPPINKKYYRGSNLIYDCEKRHFACVIEDNFNECEDLRESEYAKKKTSYTCVPLKKFTSQKECFENQMRAVETVVNRGFCLPKY